ncbi:S8 family serine peptidase [Cellulomonas alba]|uniref:S8 family serine peptidase n=1 Tax=Cellulomonas alba TaxID=3053467 RepID=A0ABT7SDW6_9CELL|nr:S8 family serine peptidase [Cellulomonas alba]MDM7854375.1 S8 family serine peptidase [Cellulomonas alba]
MDGARRRRAAGSAVVAAVVACGALAPPAAAATPPVPAGLWYVEAQQLDAAHDRSRGAGVTVGVVDGPLDPDAPDLRGADVTVHEPSFCATTAGGTTWAPATSASPAAQHGTGMASLVVGTGAAADGGGVRGVAPDARVIAYAVLTRPDAGSAVSAQCPPFAGETRGWLEGAVDQAIADGVGVLSVSLTESAAEPAVIARALHAGIVVVAAGAHDGGTAQQPPASLGGVLAVESIGRDGRPAPDAVIDAHTVLAPGEDVLQPAPDLTSTTLESGSSTATAFVAGALALVRSAYPQATASQVLQAVARTSDRAGSAVGLGTIDVTRLLATDPTALPDVNPFLGAGTSPSAHDVEAPPATSAAPTTGEDAGGARPEQTLSASSGVVQPAGGIRGIGWPLAGLAGVLVVLVAGAAAVRGRSRR